VNKLANTLEDTSFPIIRRLQPMGDNRAFEFRPKESPSASKMVAKLVFRWAVSFAGFTLLAVVLISQSSASASTIVTRPTAPRHVTAAAGTNAAIISFLPPSSNGGSRIIDYYVRVFPRNPTGPALRRCPTTRCSIPGLNNGVTYHFTVAAVNHSQVGIYSRASNGITPKSPVPSGPTITFNANGGSGVMPNETEAYGTAAALAINAFSYSGYEFTGWNTAANGSGTSYADGFAYVFTASTTLYAQWIVGTYTVTFNANGGSGVMPNETKAYGTAAALTINTFSYSGYEFTGWNTAANGSGVSYADGSPYVFTASTTLYAQWAIAVPAGTSPGWTSQNWSGYVLTGQPGGYQSVGAKWTVPTINCSSVPNGHTSDWVGVNGSSDIPGLFQDGTSSSCDGGNQVDVAWWTDQAESYSEQDLYLVNPGDDMQASVYQTASGQWAYDIQDLTSGLTSSAAEAYSGQGLSAEWIAEDPASASTGQLFPLADFGSVTFSDLSLQVTGGTWYLPTYSDAWEMVAANGTVMTLPSQIVGTGSAAAFTVYYESSG